jgi:hypothetical protein
MVLIIDGFERRTGANHRDFVIEHAQSWIELGFNIASATNQALIDDLIDLRSYPLVDWILGEESTNDHTFIPKEQELIRKYISSGGHVIVSGSEIGWDLQARAQSAADSLFLHDIFGARFRGDNADANFCLPVSMISGPDTVHFGSTYRVNSPDVFGVLGSAKTLLSYPTGGGAVIGQHFENGGGAILAGFPLETVQPQNIRTKCFELFIHFLEEK